MKKKKNVYKELSALVWKEDKWYVEKCLEVEVASQGRTKKSTLSNLREALELYLEDEPNTSDLYIYKDATVKKIPHPHA